MINGTSTPWFLICVYICYFMYTHNILYVHKKNAFKERWETLDNNYRMLANCDAKQLRKTIHFIFSVVNFLWTFIVVFLCFFRSRSRIMYIIKCKQYHFLSFIIHSLLYKCMLYFTLVFSISIRLHTKYVFCSSYSYFSVHMHIILSIFCKSH